jgi:hypothetical protein
MRRSPRTFFVLSLVSSALAFGAACDDSSDGATLTAPKVPEAGVPAEDAAGPSRTDCPAADFLDGLPPPKGGTMHGAEPGSQTWTAAGSPHIVPAGVALNFGAGTSLTVEPCALVVAGEGSSIGFGGKPGASDVGDLIAAGDATHPIVFTGAKLAKDAWHGLSLDQTGPTTRLSYVTIERAQMGDGGPSVRVAGKSAPRIDHTTVREGKGSGIRLVGEASFGAGSSDLTVTGMSIRPVVLHVAALASLPDGTFTGSADNRIEVRHEGGVVAADVTWHKRSVPYLLVDETSVTFHGKVIIEPGVNIVVAERSAGSSTDAVHFAFVDGGSLVADGGAETSRIVIEGDNGRPWAGFAFRRADPGLSLTASGTGVFDFVTLKNGAGGGSLSNGAACYDNDAGPVAPRTVIRAEHDVVDIKNTEFLEVGENNFAITRDFCGPGGAYMTEAARKNVFHGPMHCPVTDQTDCNPPTCAQACCLHAYACNGTIVP